MLAAAIPPQPAGPMSPELQEAVAQVSLHLGSKDWRDRSDALAAFSALLPALHEVPNRPLEELLRALVARLSDSNAKVNIQALQVRGSGVDILVMMLNPLHWAARHTCITRPLLCRRGSVLLTRSE